MLIGDVRIIADKRYVYENEEIHETGLTNEKVIKEIKNEEDNQLFYC